MPAERQIEYEARVKSGYRALARMEQQLATGDYLLGDNCSIADIALFAYTHVADEGGFDLNDYASIRTWIARIESLPGFVPMRD